MDKLRAFLKRARAVHGKFYDYSQVIYQNAHTKVKVGCQYHGIFQVLPCNHTSAKSGCPKCYYERKFSLTTKQFKQRARDVHGKRYNYDSAVYKGNDAHLKIQCKNHGAFTQSARLHLAGYGCSKCNNELKLADIIKKATDVHEGYYDYSSNKAASRMEIFKVGCPVHGVFSQGVRNHLKGHGCRDCQQVKQHSIGRRTLLLQGFEEQGLHWILDNTNITLPSIFESKHPKRDSRPPVFSYRHPDGKVRRYHPDFWVPDKDIVVEVKSTWTLGVPGSVVREATKAKKRAVEALGFKFKLLVMEESGKRLNIRL